MRETIEIKSEDIENIILGCMLNKKENVLVTQRVISEHDFFDPNSKKLFKAILKAYVEKGVVDTTIVGEALKNNGDFDAVGGYHRLMDLSNVAGTSAHVEAYCEDLKEVTIKRRGINASNDFFSDLKRGVSPSKAIDSFSSKIDGIKAHKHLSDSAFSHLLDPISEGDIAKEIRSTSPGVDVGFRIGDVDLKIPGGALSIVAGPTGHGKTMVLINFILNYLERHTDKQVYFFSYEESRSAILTLFLNTFINKTLSKNNRESIKSYFRYGDMQYILEGERATFQTEKDRFFRDLIETQRLNIIYSDYSADELVRVIRFLKSCTSTGLIGIDYMQLLSLWEGKNNSRQENLKQICLMLKDCAVETGFPILLAAQFNRTVSAEIDLSPTAIGEAGDIERIANMVIGIYNRNYSGFSKEGNVRKSGKVFQPSPEMYIEILKGRETGAGHSSALDLDGNTGKIQNKVNKVGVEVKY